MEFTTDRSDIVAMLDKVDACRRLLSGAKCVRDFGPLSGRRFRVVNGTMSVVGTSVAIPYANYDCYATNYPGRVPVPGCFTLCGRRGHTACGSFSIGNRCCRGLTGRCKGTSSYVGYEGYRGTYPRRVGMDRLVPRITGAFRRW